MSLFTEMLVNCLRAVHLRQPQTVSEREWSLKESFPNLSGQRNPGSREIFEHQQSRRTVTGMNITFHFHNGRDNKCITGVCYFYAVFLR